MFSSNMKSGALEREQRHGVSICSYGDKDLQHTLKKFDILKNAYTDQTRSILLQKSTYIKNFVLMEAFFKPLDAYLQEKKSVLEDYVSQLGLERVSFEQRNFFLRHHTMRVYLFLFVRFSLDKIEEFSSKKESKYSQDFFSMNHHFLQDEKNYTKYSHNYLKVFALYLEEFLSKNQEVYQLPGVMSELFWRCMEKIYAHDKKKGLLSDIELKDFPLFVEGLSKLLPDVEVQPMFTQILNDNGFSLQIMYAMLGSVAEELSLQEDFTLLTNDQKFQIFHSIKRDFLVEANYWSKQFLNDNTNILSVYSMVWTNETTGTMPTGKLRFDFKKLQISIDESTYLKDPIQAKDALIRRGCPVAFVRGEGMGGNFLARQLDFAIKMHAEYFLHLDIKKSPKF